MKKFKTKILEEKIQSFSNEIDLETFNTIIREDDTKSSSSPKKIKLNSLKKKKVKKYMKSLSLWMR